MLWGLTQGCGRQLQVLCTGRVPDRAAVWQALIRACRLFLAFLRWSLHPKLVIRLVTRHALGCGALYLLYLLGAVLRKVAARLFRRGLDWLCCTVLANPYYLQRRALRKAMESAESYIEWEKAARKLDKLEGKWAWKNDPESELYDYKRIQENLTLLRQLIEKQDVHEVMFYLRSRLSRTLAGMHTNRLYTYLRVGTKKLLEEYNAEVLRALELVCVHPSVSQADKLEFFKETRHAYGRTALLLSGGGTMGLYHLGVVRALHENNLLPQVISGSSAGSIFAAILGTRSEEELAQLGQPGSLRLQFYRHYASIFSALWDCISRFFREGVLLDINVLAECVRHNVGDYTFQEAYDKFGRIINITISDTQNRGQPLLLNFLTAPNVLIWSAAVASCAIPFVFAPVELKAKNQRGEIVPWHEEGVKYVDGSVQLDLPMERLRELYNVNHFIVSQANPHVVPFIFGAEAFKEAPLLQRLIRFLGVEIKTIITHLWGLLGVSSSLADFVTALLTQKYVGDITLVAPMRPIDLQMLLINPSTEHMVAYMTRARKYTWPFISLVNGHCEIEFALDRCVRRARGEWVYQTETRKTKTARRMHFREARRLMAKGLLSSSLPNIHAGPTAPLTNLSAPIPPRRLRSGPEQARTSLYQQPQHSVAEEDDEEQGASHPSTVERKLTSVITAAVAHTETPSTPSSIPSSPSDGLSSASAGSSEGQTAPSNSSSRTASIIRSASASSLLEGARCPCTVLRAARTEAHLRSRIRSYCSFELGMHFTEEESNIRTPPQLHDHRTTGTAKRLESSVDIGK